MRPSRAPCDLWCPPRWWAPPARCSDSRAVGAVPWTCVWWICVQGICVRAHLSGLGGPVGVCLSLAMSGREVSGPAPLLSSAGRA